MNGRSGLVLLLLLAGTACAPRGAWLPRPAPESLPVGSPLRSATLADGDAWLRHHLMFAEYDRALKLLDGSRAAPADRLLRALQEGLVLHRAGEYARSNRVLEWAEAEADRRYTRSVSRAVASLAVNDRVMAYTPSAGELVMIPYYRMLNYLALGDRDGAVVEARKANALLARLERRPEERCREDALVLYLAGLVQGAAGERNDALVSLRQAERAFAGCGDSDETALAAVGLDLYRAARALDVGEVADSVAERYAIENGAGAGGGGLLLLIEQGYIAHRAPEALHVPILPAELDGLEEAGEDGVAAAAAGIAERLVQNLAERGRWGASWYDEPAVQWAHALDGAYVLRLAWPVARREACAPEEVRVWVGDSLAAVTPASDLSWIAERELEAERPLMLARLVTRGITKFLMTRKLEQEAEERGGELAAFLAGRLGNLAANELERADTRSWSLLPDRVSMLRLHLPAGTHRVRIETVAATGEVLAVRDLGPVEIRAGELVTRSERVYGM